MLAIWFKAIIIAASTIIGLGSVYIFKMKQDNPIEEVCEEAIKTETGLNVDLTPATPETGEADLESEDNKTPADVTKPAGDVTDKKDSN